MQFRVDENKIETAIADFENEVDFEFVPVIAKKSSYTEHISWVLSLFFLIISVATIEWVFQVHLSDSWLSKNPFLLAAPFLSFVLAWLLDKSDRVDRFLISKSERIRQVQEKAELTFYRLKLDKIKNKNALILYISLMERQIVLFHDPSLEIARIDEIDQNMLKILQNHFKKSNFEEGILKLIAYLKSELIVSFAKKNADQNHVSNKLIWLKN